MLLYDKASTAWCSEIGSLWSLDAPELHASVTSENQFHCTRLYVVLYTLRIRKNFQCGDDLDRGAFELSGSNSTELKAMHFGDIRDSPGGLVKESVLLMQRRAGRTRLAGHKKYKEKIALDPSPRTPERGHCIAGIGKIRRHGVVAPCFFAALSSRCDQSAIFLNLSTSAATF